MGLNRPYKVTFHYDATGATGDPIDATRSSHELCKVRATAREVSKRGGSARVWTRDPTTGESYTLRFYEPFEVAIEDLIEESVTELLYGM